MADYYNLLSRAVSGLPNPTPDSRKAIYERARKALLGQLRAMQPPVPEADIQRESDALDAAIARLETEGEGGEPAPAPVEPPKAPPSAPPAPKPPEPAPRPVPRPAPKPSDAKPSEAKPSETKPTEAKPAQATAGEARPAQSRLAQAQPAAAKPVGRPADAKPAEAKAQEPRAPEIKPAKTPPTPPAAAPYEARPTPAAPATDHRKPVTPKPAAAPAAAPREPVRPVAPQAPAVKTEAPQPEPPRVEAQKPSVARPAAPSTAPAPQRSGGAAPALGPAAAPARPSAAPPVAGPSLKPPDGLAAPELAAPSLEHGESDAPGLSLDGEKDRPLRPLAPTPAPEKTRNLRGVIIGAVLAAVVGGMGYAAWLLREKPEDLARARVQQQQQQTSAESSGKIVERVGGGPATPPAPSQPVPTVRAPATPIRPDPSPAQQAQAQAQAPAPSQAAQPAVPVAQRSALLVEAPDDPNKVKLMVGAVTWKAENGQLRAEIEVPEAKLNASMVMKKNDDLTIAASHIMEVRFTFGPDAPYAVKDLAPPEMRRDETPNGDRLAAAVVPITSDYFLVGLARGDREASNMDLIRSRGWFDLPILLQSGRVAKVTFEKGLGGERALEEAAKSW